MEQNLLDLLAMLAGALLSVLVEIPGIKGYYDRLTDNGKRLTMTAMLVVAALVIYGLSCAGLLGIFGDVSLTCDQAGIMLLIRTLFVAIASNQSVFSLAFRGRGHTTFATPAAK